MSLVLRTANGYRDPFSTMARELLSWDRFANPVAPARPAAAFSPAFEVKETPDAFVLKADLPGVLETDLDIAVHNDILTVSGSRTAEERKEGEAYALHERRFGSFTRGFSLPELADDQRIEAKLDAGVLTLTIGKKSETKPRKIAIKTQG